MRTQPLRRPSPYRQDPYRRWRKKGDLWVPRANIALARAGILASSRATAAFEGPLDDYEADLGAAFSIRRLRSGYSGYCMRVRELNGGGQLDIGFDSNGLVNVAAIEAHIGSANADITIWYDQSGNGLDLTGTGAPVIAGAGTVITENGLPAITFDPGGGADYFLRSSVSTLSAFSADELDFYAVLKQAGANARNTVIDHNDGTYTDRTNVTATYDNTIRFDNGNPVAGDDTVVAQPSGWDDAQHLLICRREGSTQMIRVDGTDLITGDSVSSTRAAGSHTLYVGVGLGPFDAFNGTMQEIFWHRQNQSSGDRTAIEDDINTYYSIY